MKQLLCFYRITAIPDVPCGYLCITTTDLNKLMSDIDAATEKYSKSEEASKQKYNIPVCKLNDLVNENNDIRCINFEMSGIIRKYSEDGILMMNPKYYPVLERDLFWDGPMIPGVNGPKLFNIIQPMVVDVLTNDERYVTLMKYVSARISIENYPYHGAILRRFGMIQLCVSKLLQSIVDKDLIITINTDGTCRIEDPLVEDGADTSVEFNVLNYVFNGEVESMNTNRGCVGFKSRFEEDIFLAISDLQPYGGLNAISLGSLLPIVLNSMHGKWKKNVLVNGNSIKLSPLHEGDSPTFKVETLADMTQYAYWEKYSPERVAFMIQFGQDAE